MCARAAPAQQQHAIHEGSCALWRTAAALQFAVGWHKALQQCQEPAQETPDPEGRLRHRHGRAGEPRDPGEGPEGAEDTLGNSVTSQESGQSARCGMEQ